MTKQSILVSLYVLMILAANSIVAVYGPSATIAIAGLLIGPVMTIRDMLHEMWKHNTKRNMLALICATGVLSYLLNPATGMIAVASFVAFLFSECADYLVYSALHNSNVMAKANTSNVVGAVIDSLVFPTIAFGALMPSIVIGQILAKFAGGFMYSLLLALMKSKELQTT